MKVRIFATVNRDDFMSERFQHVNQIEIAVRPQDEDWVVVGCDRVLYVHLEARVLRSHLFLRSDITWILFQLLHQEIKVIIIRLVEWPIILNEDN